LLSFFAGVFFLADAEMFGLEGAIKYLATLNDVKVKICGFAHAGSYTKGDFVEKCYPFAAHYETAWSNIFDKIFVGSQYHKERLVTERFVNAAKIFVTGNPYDIEGTLASIRDTRPYFGEKKNRVICTNRPDPEKRPDLTLDVFEQLKKSQPQWEFMVTTSRRYWGSGDLLERAMRLQADGVIVVAQNLSKIEYLTLLAESKVMTGNSYEENFGYTTLEALIVDTIPILPKCCSHIELVEGDERCLFMNPRHQALLIESAMQTPFRVKQHSDQYRDSLQRIVSHLISE
jgi:glycosyltransferase involved in cell wall biosynthesis